MHDYPFISRSGNLSTYVRHTDTNMCLYYGCIISHTFLLITSLIACAGYLYITFGYWYIATVVNDKLYLFSVYIALLGGILIGVNVLIILSYTVSIVLVLVLKYKFGYNAKEAMRHTLRLNYGVNVEEAFNRDLTRAWDLTQSELFCCSVEDQGWKLYTSSKWFRTNPTAVINLERPVVPVSCCNRDLYDNIQSFKECQKGQFYMQNSIQVNNYIYQKGCFDVVKAAMFEVASYLLATYSYFIILSLICVSLIGLKYRKHGLYYASGIRWNSTKSCVQVRSRGFHKRQYRVCRVNLHLMALIRKTALKTIELCQETLKHNRWNCSSVLRAPNYNVDLTSGRKELSYIQALSAATLTHVMATECKSGRLDECSCNLHKDESFVNLPDYNFKNLDPFQSINSRYMTNSMSDIENCKNYIKYAQEISLQLTDAIYKNKNGTITKRNIKSLIGMHNHRLGRSIVLSSMTTKCRCHGVSGSCSVKTCWKALIPLEDIAKNLKKKYDDAVLVLHKGKGKKRHLIANDMLHVNRILSSNDLVYSEISPDYCSRNHFDGSDGTQHRFCIPNNSTSIGCGSMCCGRGHLTKIVKKYKRCNCHYVWCCYVKCGVCQYEEEQKNMPANSPQVENNKSIINTLLCHRQGSEDEGFAKRAIESLVKKLRDKPSELENLLTAVTTNGTMKSNCVTIQRTLDGRLQVAGRKGFPHVIYTRIWRWPNLIKNELKHSEMCRHAFDLKHELVCINPYHYERVISSGIDLVGLNLYPTANYNSLIAKSRPAKNTDDQKVSNSNAKIKKIEKSNHDKTPKVNCGNFNSNNQNFQPNTFRTEQSQTLPNDSNVWTSNIYNNNNKIPYTIQNQNVINQPPHWNVPIMDNNSQYLNHKAPIDSSNGVKTRLSNLSQPENWCTIAYFEKDQQVGETFKALAEFPAIIIDGYTDPSSLDRFCLGQLSNVHRTTDSEKA
ncbi:Protein Wnt-10a, partial [Intoshia linei]